MNIQVSEQEFSRLRQDVRDAIKWAQTFLGVSFGLVVNWLFAQDQPLPFTVAITLSITSTIAAVFLFQAIMIQVKIKRLQQDMVPSPWLPAQRFSLNNPIRPWHASTRPVVLITGYYDMLHAGHITGLQDAKKHPQELLIVGIHSDELARKEKGPNRPIMSLEQRLTAMQGVGCVDYVFEADCYYDDPPYRILEFVKPNYVVFSTEEKESEKKTKLRLFLAAYLPKHDIEFRPLAINPPILHATTLLEKLTE